MNPNRSSRPFERILVALDSSQASRAALRAAARMAARLQAELVGVYVEDEALLQTSRLPFTREVRAFASKASLCAHSDMERALRAEATKVERLLRDTARQEGVHWSFRRMRGRVSENLLRAAERADVLALGHAGRDRHHRSGLGSTSHVLLAKARRPLWIFPPHPPSLQAGLVVLFDGSEAAERALRLAISLAQSTDTELTVLVLGERKDQADRRQHAEALLNTFPKASFREGTGAGMLQVPAHVQALSGALVVAPQTSGAPSSTLLTYLLSSLSCSVLLVK